jgi:hypothetical protein
LVTEKARPYDPKDRCPLGRTEEGIDPKLPAPARTPGHGDGAFILQNFDGFNGYHTVPTASTLPAAPDSDLIVYAPTVLPPGNACIEGTTIRFRQRGSSTAYAQQGFWDHCSTHYWYYLADFSNATFASKYVRTSYGDNYPHIVLQIYETDTTNKCWQALMLNYNTGYYDIVTGNTGTQTICGTGAGGVNGWTAWESYGLVQSGSGACPSMTNVGSYYMMKHTPASGWYGLLVNTSAGFSTYQNCWTSGTYSMFTWAGGSPDWGAQTTATWTGW